MNNPPAARPPARPFRVPPVRAFTPEERARLHAALDVLMARIRHAMEAVREAFLRMIADLKDAFARVQEWQLVALEVRRTQRPRPAWATPYGPPPRRHRS